MSTVGVHASHLAWTALLGAALAAACGSRTGLLVPADLADGGGVEPYCSGTEIPLRSNAPNLYFVLDASSSMQEQGKWGHVQSAVAGVITQLGPRAAVGAAVFPTQDSADSCMAGREVMPVRLGDSQGAAAAAFLAATTLTPQGGTPTAATLAALVPELSAFPQQTFVVLATDGGPNCDPDIACTIADCTSNVDGVPGCPPAGPTDCCSPDEGGALGCLDGAATLQAVTTLRAAGVETYVMGIPGSAPYAALLDQLAVAGGSARASAPLFYQVDTADTGALTATLGEIAAAATARCVFTLTHEADGTDDVNVYIDGMVVPRDGADGWSLQGTTLTLEGATCGAAQSASTPPAQVFEGCPTVTH